MKLVMDLTGVMPLRAGMDDDHRDLIIRLCTQAGMIMEDMSELALTVRGVGNENLIDRLCEIDSAVRQMQMFISAAIALYARA